MRILWVDSAKGIAIFLVVWGHMTYFLPNEIRTIIYSFHMPLFFFLSGLFLKKENSIKLLVRKRFSSLLKPYFLYAILLLLVEYFFYLYYPPFYAPVSLKGMLTATFTNLWFLPSLFFSLIISFLILSIKKTSLKILIGLLCVILGIVNNIVFKQVFPHTFILPVLPCRIDVSLLSIPFVFMGCYFNEIKQKVKINIVFLVLSFLILVFLNFLLTHKSIDMYACDYSNFLLFYITAVLGIFLMHEISLFLKNSVLLSYLGKNSLHIYALHKIFILPVQILLIKIFNIHTDNFFLSFLAAILAIFLCVLFKSLAQKKNFKIKSDVASK